MESVASNNSTSSKKGRPAKKAPNFAKKPVAVDLDTSDASNVSLASVSSTDSTKSKGRPSKKKQFNFNKKKPTVDLNASNSSVDSVASTRTLRTHRPPTPASTPLKVVAQKKAAALEVEPTAEKVPSQSEWRVVGRPKKLKATSPSGSQTAERVRKYKPASQVRIENSQYVRQHRERESQKLPSSQPGQSTNITAKSSPPKKRLSPKKIPQPVLPPQPVLNPLPVFNGPQMLFQPFNNSPHQVERDLHQLELDAIAQDEHEFFLAGYQHVMIDNRYVDLPWSTMNAADFIATRETCLAKLFAHLTFHISDEPLGPELDGQRAMTVKEFCRNQYCQQNSFDRWTIQHRVTGIMLRQEMWGDRDVSPPTSPPASIQAPATDTQTPVQAQPPLIAPMKLQLRQLTPPPKPKAMTGAERQRKYRAKLAQEKADDFRAQELLQQRVTRAQQSPLSAAETRRRNAAQHRQRAHQQRLLAGDELRKVVADIQIPNETRTCDQPPAYDESLVPEHYAGPMDVYCRHCGAKHFESERNAQGDFTICCRSGRLRFPVPEQIFPFYEEFTNVENPNHAKLMGCIRVLNGATSFTSSVATIHKPPGYGPYVFMINGAVYHYMSPLIPNAPMETRKAAALYFTTDKQAAIQTRLNYGLPYNLDETLLRDTLDFLHRHNPFVKFFMHTAEQFDEYRRQGQQVPRISLAFNPDFQIPGIHPGRQNAPTTSEEVAAVFPLNEEGIPEYDRDIMMTLRHGVGQMLLHGTPVSAIQAHPRSPYLFPLKYALLAPFGELGWRIQWTVPPFAGRPAYGKTVTLTQWTQWQIQVRDDHHFVPIWAAGSLFQEFVVEFFSMVESERLDYIRSHQDDIRAYQYRIQRALASRAERLNMVAAPVVILPTSFYGSIRHLQETCADAMSLFSRFGQPDYFITLTCNPRWSEITESMLPGQKPTDRPDIVCRVFHLKLQAMVAEVKAGVYGPPLCWVYTIEFQKRGLPHAHMLLTVHRDFKPNNTVIIDLNCAAEIPDPIDSPRAYQTVCNSMMHGPCTVQRCLNERGYCNKGYPHRYCNCTIIIVNGYPMLKCRNFDCILFHMANNRTRSAHNRFVVPHSPYFILRYNCHLCVLVVTMLEGGIKYLFKYVFKGFDVGSFILQQDKSLNYDEIKNYLSCRYLGAMEAIWRLMEFRLHEMSHSVVRMTVHLENMQQQDDVIGANMNDVIANVADHEPVDDNLLTHTMLTAFFAFNAENPSRKFLYGEMPEHCVFSPSTKVWTIRQRQHSTVGRVHIVDPTQRELFAERALLTVQRGPTSFRDLRTFQGVAYNTNLECAIAMNLVRDDQVYLRSFEDMAVVRMPHTLRRAFISLMRLGMIVDARPFWPRFADALALDYRNHNPRLTVDQVHQMVLAWINYQLGRFNRDNAWFGLPMPGGDPANAPPPDPVIVPPQQNQVAQMNLAQQTAFDTIIAAVVEALAGRQPAIHCFFINGPGGTGKTFVYLKTLGRCHELEASAIPTASTGIAAMNMPNGATVHSVFGLPSTLDSRAVSWLFKQYGGEKWMALRVAVIILIDEISMINKWGLKVIDDVLRAIMNNDLPFGGKIIVAGGDFRQLLPVLPGEPRESIVAQCVNASPLWRHFHYFVLDINMRVIGNNAAHAQWLLDLGDGTLPVAIANNATKVEIPQDMILVIPDALRLAFPVIPNTPDQMPIELRAMIHEIFGADIAALTTEQLSERAILTTTLKSAMFVNNHVIAGIPGGEMDYFSADSVQSVDPADAANFSLEYLHRQQPSGMPPHKLTLKVGVVVMLMRNIDPTNGLSNGTRLTIVRMLPNTILARIISECHRGEEVFINRMELVSTDKLLPVLLVRFQYPIIPAYSMTVNKSQGQTLNHCGIFLNDVCFSHGQLYVALSRSRQRETTKVHIADVGNRQGHLTADKTRVFTENVVFREVFGPDNRRRAQQQVNLLPDLAQVDPQLVNIVLDEIQHDLEEEEEEANDAIAAQAARAAEDDETLRQMFEDSYDEHADVENYFYTNPFNVQPSDDDQEMPDAE